MVEVEVKEKWQEVNSDSGAVSAGGTELPEQLEGPIFLPGWVILDPRIYRTSG